MNRVELLRAQTADAYQWVNKLVESIPPEKWDSIPANVETNISWQIGHLILSFNYHSIMVIKGSQTELYHKFPIQEYAKLFVDAPPSECVGKTESKALIQHLKLVEDKSIDIISQLSDAELDDVLIPTKAKHPLATNKFEALDWNIKHTMWHCGQIGILKRILDKRYDFGLKA